jgi:ubiquinone/menaquinone biosynthesis C-methylase UbiE
MSAAARAARRTAYTRDAAEYDRRTTAHDLYRRMAVDALDLRPGDVVLDLGCGTGLCFAAVQERIGPGGTIVGVDASGAMLALARRRAVEHRWANVELVGASVADAELPSGCDRALFCAVHDVLQSGAAIDNVLSRLRPGGLVTAVGGKWAPVWAAGLNAAVLALHAPYVEDFTNFARPWSLLADRVPGLAVRDIAFGCGYVASGSV